MAVWVEGNKAALRSKRSHAFETMVQWLLEREPFMSDLPEEPDVVVLLYLSETLPGSRGRSVGEFVVYDSKERVFPDQYIVRVTMGRKSSESFVEDWWARLTTLPHELLHLIEWYDRHGGTPADVAASTHGAEALAAQSLSAIAEHESGAEDPEEQLSRKLTTEFLDAHPEYAEWL